mmetsp:Transcript_13532/g.24134  ORF Transcript_13532/g.24134 Transcript_13532/m.24134 type:complete len:87 (+) Transcript_13532:217-477(+)
MYRLHFHLNRRVKKLASESVSLQSQLMNTPSSQAVSPLQHTTSYSTVKLTVVPAPQCKGSEPEACVMFYTPCGEQSQPQSECLQAV